eukprot:2863780-Rhodomonas_salina.1
MRRHFQHVQSWLFGRFTCPSNVQCVSLWTVSKLPSKLRKVCSKLRVMECCDVLRQRDGIDGNREGD